MQKFTVVKIFGGGFGWAAPAAVLIPLSYARENYNYRLDLLEDFRGEEISNEIPGKISRDGIVYTFGRQPYSDGLW
jgi:hypothetical protein